ncbi:unnamed protein product [Leuciscus chuanchicus]
MILHDICIALGDELTQCLPALHALTGCDTTSKTSTKLAALNTVHKPDNSSLILNFNCPQLTESAMQMAETFLVKCLKPSTDMETFDETTCAFLRSIVMPLRWTLRGPLAPQLMQENIYKEPVINSSFKHHIPVRVASVHTGIGVPVGELFQDVKRFLNSINTEQKFITASVCNAVCCSLTH